jgi:beta-N-acetylglucosaminidase
MKTTTFENIFDAYQLVSGAKIKGKNYDEIFELGAYDGNKRGYTLYAFENGLRFEDFSVIISETELKNNYLIEKVKVNQSIAA